MPKIIQLPFRLAWNLALLAIIIGLFVAWWGFLGSSWVGFAVIVLIFFCRPTLFIWPLAIDWKFIPVWED